MFRIRDLASQPRLTAKMTLSRAVEEKRRSLSYYKRMPIRNQRYKQQKAEHPYEDKPPTAQRIHTSILKLPFINDRLAHDVRRTVRSYSKNVRVVFKSGQSLKDMLVRCLPRLPVQSAPEKCTEGRQTLREGGGPVECHACDVGMSDGQCMSQNVVYSMFCSVCGEEYVGETERCVRERFQEHCRKARVCAPQKRWGEDYAFHHPLQHPYTAPFIPFT